MADGIYRPAIIIAGLAGLCVSGAIGVGLGEYTTTGINPLYVTPAQPRLERAAMVEPPQASDDNGGLTPIAYRPSTLSTAQSDGDVTS